MFTWTNEMWFQVEDFQFSEKAYHTIWNAEISYHSVDPHKGTIFPTQRFCEQRSAARIEVCHTTAYLALLLALFSLLILTALL